MSVKTNQLSEPKRRITFMLDTDDIAELEALAQSQRVSLAWVLRDAVKMYLSDRAPLLRPATLLQHDRHGI